MTDRTAEVFVKITDNAAQAGPRIGQNLDRGAQQGQRAFGRLDAVAQRMAAGLDQFANRYTALAGGFIAGKAIQGITDIDTRLRALQNSSGASADKISGLRKKLDELSLDEVLAADPDQMLAGIEKIVARTGSLDLAIDNLETLALTVRAANAAGADTGELIAFLDKTLGVKGPADIAKAIAIMNESAKEGSVELKDFVAKFPTLATAFAATGQQGLSAVRDLAAVSQVAITGSDSVDMMATAVSRLIDALTIENRAMLENSGIQIMDPTALKNGVQQTRAIADIITDIIEKSKGNSQVLGKVFDIQAFRALRPFLVEFQQTGKIANVQAFRNVAGDVNVMMSDARNNAEGLAVAGERFKNAMFSIASDQLTKPLEDLAKAISSIDPETLKFALTLAGSSAALLAGTSLVGKTAGLLATPAAGAVGSALIGGAPVGGALTSLAAIPTAIAVFAGAAAAFDAAVSIFRVSNDPKKSDAVKAAEISEIVATKSAGFAAAWGAGVLGATVGAATGPLAPVAVPVLATAFAAGGYMFGEKATEAFIDGNRKMLNEVLFASSDREKNAARQERDQLNRESKVVLEIRTERGTRTSVISGDSAALQVRAGQIGITQ